MNVNEKKIKSICTAIVAGGAGFIGTHLCGRLLKEGYNVVCIDNLYTGRYENIHRFMDNKNFSFINHDVTIPFSMKGVGIIFNLACPASPLHYQKDAVYTTRSSVIGTINMLNLANQNNCMLLQASTSEVYGESLIHPQSESYYGNVNIVGIRSCYDEGKRCAESLCMDYHRQYGTRIKIVRIFNTYGNYMSQDDGRVISNFIYQALRGDSITIYGDGNQTRCFMHVNDLIDGLLSVIQTSDDITGPINLGNPEEHTINELADIIIKITHSSSMVTYKKLPENDPVRRRPDITLAKKILHWYPQISLRDGLLNVIRLNML